MNNDQTIEYYQKRAREYDKIYFRNDSLRQAEIHYLYALSRRVLVGRDILDIACGTGFWTRIVSDAVQSVIGLDINSGTLEVAREKTYRCPVDFIEGDFLNIGQLPKKVNGLLATFVMSHIKRQDYGALKETIARHVPPGSPIFFCDNNLICEVKPELIPDEEGINTYKKRILENGEEYTILKNYFEADELKSIFSDWGEITDFYFRKYYWAVCVTLA
ncbi:MAG: class I SAM-dependent methyltransferase [Candidatus Zixiibacteriota bacterium]